MSALEELRFTKLNLKLSEFVVQFRDELPVILIANTGIDPSDDPLHCVSAEQIYWIQAIYKQKRIIAADITKDQNRRYFSIPVDYDRKFQLVTTERRNEILSPPMYMKQIVEGMILATGPARFVFAHSDNIRVNFEGSKSVCQQIGILEVIEAYEQKYLVGHTLYQTPTDVMDMRPCSIPVYLDITVDVANGFNGRNDAAFKEWTETVNELGRCNRKATVSTCEAIIQYQKLPECGVYEYMQPLNYLKTQDIKKTQEATKIHATGQRNIYSMRPPIVSCTEDDANNSTPPPIPERTWTTIRLPPIPSHTPNHEPVVGTRRKVPAPPCTNEVHVYDESRPSEPANLKTRKGIGSYEIVPYAESKAVFKEPLTTSKDKLKATLMSVTSQEEANPYTECTPEAIHGSEGGFATQRDPDEYKIAPHSENKPIFPEHLRKNNRRATSCDISLSAYDLANLSGKCEPIYPDKFPKTEGKTIEAEPSVTSENVKVKLYPSERRPISTASLPGAKDFSETSTTEIDSNIYDECKTVTENRLLAASKVLAIPYEDCTPAFLETAHEVKDEADKTNAYDEPIECKSLNPLSDDVNTTNETKASNDYEEVQSDSFKNQKSTPVFQFNHISEIPPDFNVSELSVAEVAHCLSLLGLSEYAEVFQKNDVDGKLISDFSRETLVSFFNFSEFEALKFIKFLQGWRPHIK